MISINKTVSVDGHTVNIVCTRSFSSSVCHLVTRSISTHLAVVFTTAFPVKIPYSVKYLKITKFSKINKQEFIVNLANSEFTKALHKPASLLSHRYFHTLKNILDKHAPSIQKCKIPQLVCEKASSTVRSWLQRGSNANLKGFGEETTAVNCTRYRAAVNHFNLMLEPPNQTLKKYVETEDNPKAF